MADDLATDDEIASAKKLTSARVRSRLHGSLSHMAGVLHWSLQPDEQVREAVGLAIAKNGSTASFQANLLRDLIGEPFSPSRSVIDVLSPEVISFANSIYMMEDFHQVRRLADMVAEFDGADSLLVRHLRNSQHHALGCWAIDRIIGKM